MNTNQHTAPVNQTAPADRVVQLAEAAASLEYRMAEARRAAQAKFDASPVWKRGL